MLAPTSEFIFWYKHQPVETYSDGEIAWTSFSKTAKCFDYYAEKRGKAAGWASDKESTPELDGDTEFERVIMKIPADREHMVKLTHIFDRHLTALRAVNAKPYNTVMEQLKELAKS